MSVSVSSHGNVSRFESPAGHEHYFGGDPRSGYQVCYSSGPSFAPRFDFGSTEAGLGAAVTSEPNGAGRFPIEISRTTADGAITITRRITGNSFVGGASTGGTYDTGPVDGIGCDGLGECGNCTNRTIHVLTRVKNNTDFDQTVTIVEMVDVDLNEGSGERGLRTSDSVTLAHDVDDGTPADGMLLQSLITPASGFIYPYSGYFETASGGPPFDCNTGFTDGPPLATPTTPGDNEMVLMQTISVPAGATNSGSIRVHHRRY